MSYTKQKEYAIIHLCGRCKKKQKFISTRKFRINANKNKLDIWLIYQCGKCGHTLNVPIYQRVPPRKIPQALYEKFLGNDEALAVQYGSDRSLFKRGRFVIEK